MEALCRNKIVKIILSTPAYLLTGALCVIGLMKTSAELSEQNMWFAYSVVVILVCVVLTWISNIRRVRLGIIDLAAVMFFAWWECCYLLNNSIAVSKLLDMCFLAVMYMIIRVLLSAHRNISRWPLAVLCVCGIIEATIGIQQAFGFRHSNHTLFRITGTFFNPGPYGGYIAVIVSMALGYVVSRWGFADRVFRRFSKPHGLTVRRVLWTLLFCVVVGAIVGIMIILPATMSRTAYIAVGAAAVAIFLSDGRIRKPVVDRLRRNTKTAVAVGVISMMVVCGGAYGIYSLKKDSAYGRLLIWKTGAKVMIDHTLTGVGPGYFRGAYGNAQAEYFQSGEGSKDEINVAGSPEYGFNEFIVIGAETGIPGFVLFVSLVCIALCRLLKAGSPYAFGLLALIVFACFSYPFSLLPVRVIFVTLLAVAGSSSLKRHEAKTVERVIVGIAIVGCVVMTTLVNKPYMDHVKATKEWHRIRHWYSMEMYSSVVEDYTSLLPLVSDNPTFLFEYGRSLNQVGKYSESLDILDRATRLSNDPMNYNVIGNNYKALGEYDRAAEVYLKAYHIIPSRMYPLYLLAKMYSENGDMEQAHRYARMVVEMTPKIPSPATADMQREMRELLESSAN